uniref:CMP/dCMP-type deaminase domain-containing protein n=1 Tax=Ascaris lumbricoides TaxID=6252 RepID=A0A0M3IE19_ASCLU
MYNVIAGYAAVLPEVFVGNDIYGEMRTTPKRKTAVVEPTPDNTVSTKKQPADKTASEATSKERFHFCAGKSELPPGAINKVCKYRRALYFTNESEPCCSGGLVKVEKIRQLALFKKLYSGKLRHSNCFLNSIRDVNSMFAMVSLSAKEEKIAGGMQIYRISGEIYVNVSDLYERGPTWHTAAIIA